MFRWLKRRLSYANVMSTIAVFAALGTGGATAANTIVTGDIVDSQVTSADVRDDTLGFGGLAAQDLGPGSVRSSEVQDNSLTGADINEDSLGRVTSGRAPPSSTATSPPRSTSPRRAACS
jgi:hypothetical protein